MFATAVIWIAFVAGCVVCVPATVLFVECLAALLPRPKQQGSVSRTRSVDILIPAHDEAQVLGSCLASVAKQLRDGDRVLVIADHCTDNTAEIAREFARVEVVELEGSKCRGKGYALAKAVADLAVGHKEVVLMLDADCTLAPGSIDWLVHTVERTGAVVQARYVMAPGRSDKPSISQIAVIVKNLVRPLGLKNLGFPCLLTGSGMAFPWNILSTCQLANENTADDMQLSCELLLNGHEIVFCPEAMVTGGLAPEGKEATRQRRRWVHGHLYTLCTYFLPLVLAAVKRFRLRPFAVALEISIPPLSLLMVLWGLGLGGTVSLAMLTGQWLVALPWLLAGGMLCSAMLAASRFFDRSVYNWRVAGELPRHVVRVLAMVLSLRSRQKWSPTPRDVVDEI